MLSVRTPRFFLDVDTDSLQSSFSEKVPFLLPAGAARHAGRALRLRDGDTVTLFNGSGWEFFGVIHFSKDETTVEITEAHDANREAPIRLTLVQSWVAPEKLDWIVEKATECGVAHIVMVPAQRSVTKLSGDRLTKRLTKCQEIAKSAAEQCGRNVLPTIEAAPNLKAALSGIEADARLLLAPSAKAATPLPETLASCAFAIGPEGGFSPEEIALAEDLGWSAHLLGPRVLRTETAGLAAAVWLNTRYGDY